MSGQTKGHRVGGAVSHRGGCEPSQRWDFDLIGRSCSDCGHILFFNAAPMGVAPATGGVGGRFSIPSA